MKLLSCRTPTRTYTARNVTAKILIRRTAVCTKVTDTRTVRSVNAVIRTVMIIKITATVMAARALADILTRVTLIRMAKNAFADTTIKIAGIYTERAVPVIIITKSTDIPTDTVARVATILR